MKTKLDTDGLDSDKKIKTEFYILDKDTNQYSLVNRNKYIQLEDIEETLKYNSEVLPVFQFVKVWTQSTGGWGVTLKLKKVRIKNSVYSEQGDAIFLDDDNYEQTEKVMPPKPPSAPTPTPVNKQKLVEVESDDDSDEESDEEVAQVVASKVKVEKSDSESDDEPVKPKQVTKIVASDSESDEDVKPKKPIKKVTKAKKASA